MSRGADHLALDEDIAPAIEWRGIHRALRRHWPAMLAIVGAALVLGVLVTRLVMPRIYEARASVQIEQQVSRVLGTEDADTAATGADEDRFLQTEIDIFNSRAMAKRVGDTLHLVSSGAFLQSVNYRPRDGDTADMRDSFVIDALRKNLIVSLPKNSRILTVYYRSPDPVLAARIANAFCSGFIAGNFEQKLSTKSYSRTFLEGELNHAKDRLEASERALIAYARSAVLIDASAGAMGKGAADGPRSLVTADLVELNISYSEAQAERLRAEQAWQQAQGEAVMTLPEVLADKVIEAMLEQRTALSAQIVEMRQHLKPDHPKIQQAQAQLGELNAQVATMADRVRTSIRNRYEVALHQESAIAGKVAQLQNAALSEQDRGVQYNILKREVETNRQLYESLLQRYKNVSAEAGVTANNITQLDIADVPERPVSPVLLLNMALALMAGLALALLYAIGREQLAGAATAPPPADPLRYSTRAPAPQLPLLGTIALPRLGSPFLGVADPLSVSVQHDRAISRAIEARLGGVARLLLVTSDRADAAAPTMAVDLALDAVRAGQRVVLVDADAGSPALPRLLGLAPPPLGLSAVLAGSQPLAQVIYATRHTHLALLPAGESAAAPVAWSAAAVRAICGDLVQRFDVTIVSGPPLADGPAVAVWAGAAQATILIEPAEAGARVETDGDSELRRACPRLLGCVRVVTS